MRRPQQTDHMNNQAIDKTCGVVMPISAADGCGEQHWVDVKSIIFDAIKQADLDPNLVSDADDVGVIQKRIVQNIYENRIVVCDVSTKNPNVMFELGMRLAFDKPAIIVKDDRTSFSFDTGQIEHLEYPRDLRFNRIIDFNEKLVAKIKATLKAAEGDGEYTTFLGHFGKFITAQLQTTEVSKDEYIIQELREIRQTIDQRIGRIHKPRVQETNEQTFSKELFELIVKSALAKAEVDCEINVDSARKLVLKEMHQLGIQPVSWFPDYSDFAEALTTVLPYVNRNA